MARTKGSKNKAPKIEMAEGQPVMVEYGLGVDPNDAIVSAAIMAGAEYGSGQTARDSSFIKPLVEFDNHKNLYKEMFEENPDEIPEITAFGFHNMKMGRHTWISYKLVIKGDRVISMEVSEPDQKAIAYEAAAIDFQQESEKDA